MGARYKLDVRFETDDEEIAIEAHLLFGKLFPYMVDNINQELTRWNETSGKWEYINVG